MLKAFCVNCGKFTECSIIVQEEESNVRGTSFRYSNTVPICNACRNEVYIASINDANVVDLPEPVGPVIKTIPFFISLNVEITSGSPNAFIDGIL